MKPYGWVRPLNVWHDEVGVLHLLVDKDEKEVKLACGRNLTHSGIHSKDYIAGTPRCRTCLKWLDRHAVKQRKENK